MKCKYNVVMFDLDGTLSDSANGVESGLRYALTAMNYPIPDLSDRSIYMGPPLSDTFMGYCHMNQKENEQAIALYKSYYETTGVLQNKLYHKQLPPIIANIRKCGGKAVVATSKFEPFAVKITEEILGLKGVFDAICGADGNRKAKADVINYALDTLGCKKPKESVLIGDTVYDIIGANKSGCDFIGVTYGFGSVQQMKEQGATKFADDADALNSFLFLQD